MARARTTKKPGRPRKKPAIRTQLVALMRAGAFLWDACDELELGRRTVYEWLRRGRAENPPPGDAEYVVFVRKYRAAVAAAKREAMARVRRDPKGHAGEQFFLERRFPEQFGRRLKTELTGKNGGSLQVGGAVAMYLPAERDDDDDPGGGSGPGPG